MGEHVVGEAWQGVSGWPACRGSRVNAGIGSVIHQINWMQIPDNEAGVPRKNKESRKVSWDSCDGAC